MPDRHHKARWAARRAKGLCGDCGVVPSEKYSRCTLCRQFLNETRRAWWHGRAKWRINKMKRAAYALNPEPFKQRALAYRENGGLEKERLRNKAYYQANREVLKARARERYWRKKDAQQAA